MFRFQRPEKFRSKFAKWFQSWLRIPSTHVLVVLRAVPQADADAELPHRPQADAVAELLYLLQADVVVELRLQRQPPAAVAQTSSDVLTSMKIVRNRRATCGFFVPTFAVNLICPSFHY